MIAIAGTVLALAAWGGVLGIVAGWADAFPPPALAAAAGPAAAMLSWRAWSLWLQVRPGRARGEPAPPLRLDALAARPPPQVLIGHGREWSAADRQALQHAGAHGAMRDGARPDGPRREALHLPAGGLRGNLLVVGAPGSGKTLLFQMLALQAVGRGDALVVLDPKGSADLERELRRACHAHGRPFACLHPGRRADCVRFDPLRHFDRPAELATRIARLVPAGPEGLPFVQFAWRVLHVAVRALLRLGRRPDLRTLRACAQDQCRGLAAAVSGLPSRPDDRVSGDPSGRAVDALKLDLAAVAGHDAGHYGKMILSLMPVLDMLTQGDLGEVLSPRAVAGDRRPVWDMRRVLDQRAVLHVGLDALSDPMVGGAVGALVLADLAALVGQHYRDADGPVPLTLLVDEAAEALDPAFVQLLNKGREAGLCVGFATQTLADFEAALGTRAQAEVLMGNAAHVVALRTQDAGSREALSRRMGRCMIRTTAHARSESSRSSDAFAHFDGASTQMNRDEEVDLVPPDLLGRLPDGHFFAALADGRVLRGELPRPIGTHRTAMPAAAASERRGRGP